MSDFHANLGITRWWGSVGHLAPRPRPSRVRLSRASGDEFRLPVPKCSWCKRVKLGDAWVSLSLTEKQAPTILTHGICPPCGSSLRAAMRAA